MAGDRSGIIFAGNLIVDLIKFVDVWPRETGFARISNQVFSTGGLVCNCSVDMAKLAPEVPVSIIGLVGDDELADVIFEKFSNFPSIDTSLLKRVGDTSFTDVITSPGGERTFFHYTGSASLFGPEYFDFSKINAAILHIGYILLLDKLDAPDPDYPTGMCRVLDAAQKSGILTSVDIVSETGDRYKTIATPALAYADILTINDIEAEGVTGIKLRDSDGRLDYEALEPCARALAALGVRKWVCVHMPEISVGIDVGSGEYIAAKTLSIPEDFVKSSVGAGDGFATGLLYAVYRGLGLREAIDEGNAVAACSLQGSGASDSIKPLAELLVEMERYR